MTVMMMMQPEITRRRPHVLVLVLWGPYTL